ncbi:oxidoreductase [Enterobacteriaceae bacterium 4M9]|nr:oxidoreductase [Enterobacteriaceae bacterium 4M9]
MSEQITLRVTGREEQGTGVVVLTLCAANGDVLPAFAAGAHIDLHLADGLVRQYSLCGNPQDTRHWQLGILNAGNSRGGSQAACLLQPGDEVQASLPRNLFALTLDAPHTLLVGGGIGITPMLAMAHALHQAGRAFELHYCGRSRARMAFLAALAAVPWAAQVVYHVSDEGETCRLQPDALLAGAPANSHLYVCGPQGFMDWVIDKAESAGLAPTHIHREYFNREVQTSGEAFEVVVPALGVTVQVAQDQSIVEALAQAGVRVKVSCQQGICGTCIANVLEGTPEHRDSYLTEEEKADNDQIALCCSRSRSPCLVIEVFELE